MGSPVPEWLQYLFGWITRLSVLNRFSQVILRNFKNCCSKALGYSKLMGMSVTWEVFPSGRKAKGYNSVKGNLAISTKVTDALAW